MDEISSKFSWFSKNFITIRLVPTNHNGTQAIESLSFVCSQKPTQSGVQNYVLINPHNWVEQKKLELSPLISWQTISRLLQGNFLKQMN